MTDPNPTPQATEIVVTQEDVRAAFEAAVNAEYRSRCDSPPHSFRLSETGQAYASAWVQQEFVGFARGYFARLQSTEQRLGQDADGGGVGELVAELPEIAVDLEAWKHWSSAGIVRQAADALTSLLAERDRLREALRPFVGVRDQYPQSAKLIDKKLDGFAPVKITVTKDQFLAALNALNPNKDDNMGGGE